MTTGLYRKGMVFTVICLFLLTGLSSVYAGSITIKNDSKILISNYIIKNDNVIAYTDGLSNKQFLNDNILNTCILMETNKSSGFTKGTIYFTNPDNNDVIRAGDNIFIRGTISGKGFKNYIIEYGQGINPSEWYTTGITLSYGGNLPIKDDTVAIWDTGHITVADFYSLKIKVNFDEPETMYIKDIFLDPSLKDGWPQRINYEPIEGTQYYNSVGYSEPVVSDIDNDGYKEIIIYSGGSPPKIYVFKHDGSLFWKVSIGSDSIPGGNLHIPIVGDLNNDSMMEIIVFNLGLSADYSEIYAFDSNGNMLPNWPVLIPSNDKSTLLMADLDLDGFNEIIVKASGTSYKERYMSIINRNGNVISEFKLENKIFGWAVESTPAVGNFDDDVELEIVVADPSKNANSSNQTSQGVIHIYNIDGSEVDGWPVYTDGLIRSSPAIGDINNNGDLEIVVALAFIGSTPNYNYGGVYVFDKNGSVLPGWPFQKGWVFLSSPSLADFDGDNKLEIVISQIGNFSTYVLHYDGTVASNWPQSTTWNDYYSTITGDINSDGILDILTTAGGIYSIYTEDEEPGGVYAWNFNGTLIEGFPKVTEIDAQAPATIADIDNDGKIELIASSNDDIDSIDDEHKRRNSIYVWELYGDHNPETMYWPTFHHDNKRTGLYLSNENNPPFKPDIDGPADGKVDVEYEYNFATIDPNGNDICYLVNWGDDSSSGWTEYVASGTQITLKHTWSKKGTYEIRVKARDIYRSESDWSDPFPIMMPKNKVINPFLLFLERFMERFPILEQILQPIYDKLTGF